MTIASHIQKIFSNQINLLKISSKQDSILKISDFSTLEAQVSLYRSPDINRLIYICLQEEMPTNDSHLGYRSGHSGYFESHHDHRRTIRYCVCFNLA